MINKNVITSHFAYLSLHFSYKWSSKTFLFVNIHTDSFAKNNIHFYGMTQQNMDLNDE